MSESSTAESVVLHAFDAYGASSKVVAADGTERDIDTWRYDARGGVTKVSVLSLSETSGGHAAHYFVEGSELACSAPGAATSTTTYDESGRPVEVRFEDAGHAVLRRVIFSRDEAGRVLSERWECGDAGALLAPGADRSGERGRNCGPLPQSAVTQVANAGSDPIDVTPVADAGADPVDANSGGRGWPKALLDALFGDDTFSLTTNAYDAMGRRIACVRRIGRVSEERLRTEYDDLDNPITQTREDRRREIRVEEGAVTTEDLPSLVEHVRFEYRYDAHGNWIERISWQRIDGAADERPSECDRRAISYYDELEAAG